MDEETIKKMLMESLGEDFDARMRVQKDGKKVAEKWTRVAMETLGLDGEEELNSHFLNVLIDASIKVIAATLASGCLKPGEDGQSTRRQAFVVAKVQMKLANLVQALKKTAEQFGEETDEDAKPKKRRTKSDAVIEQLFKKRDQK